MKYGTGAIVDIADARDYQWSEVGFGSAPFDWKVGYDIEEHLGGKKIPAKDQNGSGSCGGQAWSYYDATIEYLFTGTYEERSARFIYGQVFVNGGGSAGRDICELLKNTGVVQEKDFTSYDNGLPPSEAFMEKPFAITEALKQLAREGKIVSYANVDVNIDTIAQAIRDNGGVVLGVVGQDNGTWLSEFPKPPVTGKGAFWYHWIYAAKAKTIKGKKYIGFINSWGQTTGNQGWQWLSEDYINTILVGDSHGQRAIWQAWTMVFNKQPITGLTWNFKKDLEIGMTNSEVSVLQYALQLQGCFPAMTPTNYYGPITQTAVQKFQVKYGIAGPGVLGYGRCGPKTRAKLNEIYK